MPPLYKTGLINILFPKIYRDRAKFIDYVVRTVNERLTQKRIDEAGDRKDSFYYVSCLSPIDDRQTEHPSY